MPSTSSPASSRPLVMIGARHCRSPVSIAFGAALRLAGLAFAGVACGGRSDSRRVRGLPTASRAPALGLAFLLRAAGDGERRSRPRRLAVVAVADRLGAAGASRRDTSGGGSSRRWSGLVALLVSVSFALVARRDIGSGLRAARPGRTGRGAVVARPARARLATAARLDARLEHRVPDRGRGARGFGDRRELAVRVESADEGHHRSARSVGRCLGGLPVGDLRHLRHRGGRLCRAGRVAAAVRRDQLPGGAVAGHDRDPVALDGQPRSADRSSERRPCWRRPASARGSPTASRHTTPVRCRA